MSMAELFYPLIGLSIRSRFLRRQGSMGSVLSKWKLRLGILSS
ncbi:hypothetical protein ACHAXN_004328 [Cyclotella atomus]